MKRTERKTTGGTVLRLVPRDAAKPTAPAAKPGTMATLVLNGPTRAQLERVAKSQGVSLERAAEWALATWATMASGL
jgi:hypothetical protein